MDRIEVDYKLPVKFIMRWDTKSFILTLTISTLMVSSYFFSDMLFTPDEFVLRFLVKYFLPLFGLYFIVAGFFYNILKVLTLEFQEDRIIYTGIRSYLTVYWKDISEFKITTYKKSSYLCFTSINTIANTKKNFLTFFSMVMGGNYTLKIPLNMLKDYDTGKITEMIHERLRNRETPVVPNNEAIGLDAISTEDSPNEKSAGINFYSFSMSLIIGVIYGLSMFFLKRNLMFFPFIFVMVVYFYYRKNSLSIDIFDRIWLFVINLFFYFCSIVSLLSSALYYNENFTVQNLERAVILYFSEISSIITFCILALLTGAVLVFMDRITSKRIDNFFKRREKAE